MSLRRVLPGLCAALLLSTASSDALAEKYRDARNGFAFEKPDFPAVGDASSQVVVVAGPAVNGFSANCNLQIQVSRAVTSLEGFEKLTLSQFESQGWKVLESKPTSVSGKPALRMRYAGETRGMSFEWDSVVTHRGDRFYLLTCTDLKAHFAESKALFERTIESFEVD